MYIYFSCNNAINNLINFDFKLTLTLKKQFCNMYKYNDFKLFFDVLKLNLRFVEI